MRSPNVPADTAATIPTRTGGDEWLNVTPCLAADLIRQGRFRQLAKFTRVFQRSFRLGSAEVLKSTLWTFGLRRLIGGAADAIAPTFWRRQRHQREIRKTLQWVAPDPAIRRAMDERCERLLPEARPGPGGFYDREMRTALTYPSVAMEDEEHFQFGRRVGVSMLHPYLDPDLVQPLYGMSPDALVSGGRTKGLVRDTVARQFPELGFERARKVDATGFFRGVLQREGPAAWQARDGARTFSTWACLLRRPSSRSSTVCSPAAGRTITIWSGIFSISSRGSEPEYVEHQQREPNDEEDIQAGSPQGCTSVGQAQAQVGWSRRGSAERRRGQAEPRLARPG